MGKCRELNAETVANRAKVQTSQKLSHDDQQTIAELKEVSTLVNVMFKHWNSKKEHWKLTGLVTIFISYSYPLFEFFFIYVLTYKEFLIKCHFFHIYCFGQ